MKFSKILLLSAVFLTTAQVFASEDAGSALIECQSALDDMQDTLYKYFMILSRDGYFYADGELKPEYTLPPYSDY